MQIFNKVFIRITDILPSGRKKLKETLGPVTSDYQKFLEEKWIEDLKVKYPVALYDGALNELFSDQK